MKAWYSTEQVQQMIDFLRRSANENGGLDVGNYWALCDEAADMIESMLHYEQSHGLRNSAGGGREMTWHIEKIAYELDWLVTNGKVEFLTNDKRAAEWLCRLCNWITDDGEESPSGEDSLTEKRRYDIQTVLDVIAALEAAKSRIAEMEEALKLADAALECANMNMDVVKRKVKAAIAKAEGKQ